VEPFGCKGRGCESTGLQSLEIQWDDMSREFEFYGDWDEESFLEQIEETLETDGENEEEADKDLEAKARKQ